MAKIATNLDILNHKIKHDEIIINDLRKLFSGRKFVDYIATERLKYVALEASKRLKEITKNNYGHREWDWNYKSDGNKK